MKRKYGYFGLIVASLFLFFACEKEQSQLDIDSLKERAVVSGYIIYNAGVDTTSNTDYVTDQWLPVEKQTIYVEIPYGDLSATSTGNYVVEATTDSLGRYSVEVPTTFAGVSATVRMKEFSAFKTTYEEMKDGKPVFKTEIYNYSFVENIPAGSLRPGTAWLMDDVEVKCAEALQSQEDLNLKERITLTGNVQLAYEMEFRQGAYKSAAGADVEFTVTYPHMAAAGFPEFKFTTKADGSGNYSITLPIENYTAGFHSVDISVKGQGTSYTHYSAPGVSKVLAGAYEEKGVWASGGVWADIVENMDYEMPAMYLKFTPGFNNNITPASAPSTWSDNLAGWERYAGFTETKTITGKYLLAVQSGFGVGAYTNASQQAKIKINYPTDARGGSKIVVVNTAVDGLFSFEVPVKDASEDLAPAFEVPGAGVFEHYVSAEQKVKLSGTYASAANPVRDITSEWYEMGTQYYNFTPSDAVKAAKLMWDADLAAWKLPVAIEAGKGFAKEVSGTVYMAQETGLATGDYVKGEGILAKIKIDGINYAFPVVQGEFKGDVYVLNETTEPTVEMTVTKKTKDFVHYAMNGKSEKIAGEYQLLANSAYWTGFNKADRASWGQLGNMYCKFTPDPLPDDWTNYFQYLAGWQRVANMDKKEEVSGKLYQAIETAYYNGNYVPAKSEIVKVIIDGSDNYVGITNSDGIYTVPVWAKNNVVPSVAVEPYFKANEVDYVTYTAMGKSETKQKKFIEEFKVGRIEGYTAWNDRGSIYYKASLVNILAWANKRNALVNGASEVITFKGAKLKAATKSDGTGGYWMDDNDTRAAIVQIGATTYYTSISGKAYNITYNVKDVASSYNFQINVEGGTSDKTAPFTYWYTDMDGNKRSETIYGYYLGGVVSATTVTRDGDTNNFFVTPEAALNDNADVTNKALLKFGVTHPTNPTTLTDWASYGAYLSNE